MKKLLLLLVVFFMVLFAFAHTLTPGTYPATFLIDSSIIAVMPTYDDFSKNGN